MWIEVNLNEKEMQNLDIFYNKLIKTESDTDVKNALKKIVETYRHNIKPQRNADILALRDKGYTFDAIANKYDISRQRVRQICIKEERKRKAISEMQNAKFNSFPAFYACLLKAVSFVEVDNGCAIRVYNCLNRAGIIQEMCENHTTLDEYDDLYLLSIRNFGPNSLALARQANVFYKELESE